MSIPATPEPVTPLPNMVPKWLSPTRRGRSRAFLVIKCVLALVLGLVMIETLSYIPLCISVIQHKRENPPPIHNRSEATASDVLLFSVIYFSFRLLVITVGCLGLLRENHILLYIHAGLIPFTVLLIFALFHAATQLLLYLSVGCNLLALVLTVLFAILIKRNDH